MQDLPKIQVSKKGAEELKKGFPWAYDTETVSLDPVADGDLCEARTEHGKFLAVGFFNSASKLRFRVVSRNASDTINEAFWNRRVRWAVEYRRKVMGEDFSCCRLIFGDADGFPGMTVDRYEDVLSSEVLCRGMDRWKDTVYAALLSCFEELGDPISCIWENSEGTLRPLEGMPDDVGFRRVEGFTLTEKPEAVITENGIRFHVDFQKGQKTGYFLDQKYNRAAVGRLAAGMRVLDCCTHTGAFALNCAKNGAASVLGIDVSQTAIDQCERNRAENGFTNVSFEKQDVFDFLTAQAEAHAHPWDLIILDPPAFTKSRSTVRRAEQGYETLNYLALRILPRGGYLVTCSCSRFMTPDLFLEAVRKAALRAGVSLKLIEKRGASPDHPVLIGAPDTEYLKCYLFQVV